MGTNYYWRSQPCHACGHSEKSWHIGKSSGGWRFLFHAIDMHESPLTRPITSAADWREVFRGEGRIFDEYQEPVTVEKFWDMVKAKAGGKGHEIFPREGYYGWQDSEENDFTTGHFS